MIAPDIDGALARLLSTGIANPVQRTASSIRPTLPAMGYQAFYGQTPFQAFQQGGFPSGMSGANWGFMNQAPAAAPARAAPPAGLMGRRLTVQDLSPRGLPSHLRGMRQSDINRLRLLGTFR